MDARQIITRWPSRRTLARDAGRSLVTIHSWWRRNSIPADVDMTLMDAARERGISLSYEDLARSRSASGNEAAA